MKAQPREDSFKITRWYMSTTLKQEFSDGVKFKTAEAIHCEPHIKRSTNKTEKLALLRLEWGYILKNYIEYIADDEYYVEFSDLENSDAVLNKIIVTSYANFLQGYQHH